MSSQGCEGCGKPDPKMQCPTCCEKGLPGSRFCGQVCFKAAWKTHKKKHSEPPPAPCFDSMDPRDREMFLFTGPIRPGKLSFRRQVPARVKRPDYADHPEGRSACEETDSARYSARIPVYNAEEIAGCRLVCKLAREVLDIAGRAVRPGITTDELDRIVHEACVERDSYPSPLNYNGFPKSVCTSVNEIICHGIPDSRELENGDIVNLDVSLFHNGYHADLNETYFVGEVDDGAKKLVKTAYECLELAIKEVKPKMFYKSMGNIIQKHAEAAGLSVVRTYCGHGVGKLFHTTPNIPHYAKNKAQGTMEPGHIFTIEPMINEGNWEDVLWPDNWTAATADGKRSAQFEHTMLVTETGVEVLTARPNDALPLFMQSM